VRLPLQGIWILWLVAALSVGVTAAPAQEISAQEHPWGRFQPGAWKVVSVVTETLDENGLVASTSLTETTTTLKEISEDGVTLEVKVAVEVAGKPFEAEPQTVKQGFHGGLLTSELNVTPAEDSQVTIEERTVPCKVLRLEFSGSTNKTTTTVYYSTTTPPYVLRRDCITTDAEGENTLSESSIQVVALDMPCKVLAEIKPAALVKSTHKHAKGTITTWAYTSTDVPGGVISYSSKEVDPNGRVVRRSTLRLVGYDLEPNTERVGLLGRRGFFRPRKTTENPPRLFPR